MQQKRSLIFQGFSRKVDNFYRFSVQLNAEFRYSFDKGSRAWRCDGECKCECKGHLGNKTG